MMMLPNGVGSPVTRIASPGEPGRVSLQGVIVMRNEATQAP